MSELQKLLGDELYPRVIEKLGGTKLLIDDGRLIPKHRFDCVNISLREHKALVEKLQTELEKQKTDAAERIELKKRCDAAESELSILELLMQAKARNMKAIRPLLVTEGLYGDRLTDAVKKQIRRLKTSDPYLFEDCALYRLVPYRSQQEEKTK